MRALVLVVLALPLPAQQSVAPCEPGPATLRLLESAPPVADVSLPFEQRVGALRALAESHPDDFFVQRAYQDSFRQHRTLADEFDRALGMYRAHPADPLSRYWEARLLRWHEPGRSMAALEELLRTNPKFVWPHLDLSEWSIHPGQRDNPKWAAHLKAFQDACPEAFVPGMVQDPMVTRRALERRNSPLEVQTWPALWRAEESSRIPAEQLAARVQEDRRRIEGWQFRANPGLFYVYREAARILKDPGVTSRLRAKVVRDAPGSTLALQFAQEDWNATNSAPDRNAPQSAWLARQETETRTYREWLKKWPNSPQLLTGVVMDMNQRAMRGEEVSASAEDLALIDQALRVREMSPDANEMWPPIETAIARIYVAAKARLVRVPDMLGAAMIKIQKQTRYELSPDLFPAELQRGVVADWVTTTTRQVEEIRVDYLLASKRPADARVLIEQALTKGISEKKGGSVPFYQGGWLRRLGAADAQEGRVKDALTHYQASMAGLDKKTLALPQVEQLWAPVKRYYMAHGGTEDKWPDWATAGSKDAALPERIPRPFVTALPEFSAADLAGKTWELQDLKGKATFVNFWATWCGPCRGEHPWIEELMQRIKGRKDIQVLTISVDEHLAPVTEYMKEKAYTFPVIHAPELADKLFPYIGLPTNFVVNSKGVRTNLYGFGPDSTSVQRAIEDLTQAAR